MALTDVTAATTEQLFEERRKLRLRLEAVQEELDARLMRATPEQFAWVTHEDFTRYAECLADKSAVTRTWHLLLGPEMRQLLRNEDKKLVLTTEGIKLSSLLSIRPHLAPGCIRGYGRKHNMMLSGWIDSLASE